jgi:hypothetical protein
LSKQLNELEDVVALIQSGQVPPLIGDLDMNNHNLVQVGQLQMGDTNTVILQPYSGNNQLLDVSGGINLGGDLNMNNSALKNTEYVSFYGNSAQLTESDGNITYGGDALLTSSINTDIDLNSHNITNVNGILLDDQASGAPQHWLTLVNGGLTAVNTEQSGDVQFAITINESLAGRSYTDFRSFGVSHLGQIGFYNGGSLNTTGSPAELVYDDSTVLTSANYTTYITGSTGFEPNADANLDMNNFNIENVNTVNMGASNDISVRGSDLTYNSSTVITADNITAFIPPDAITESNGQLYFGTTYQLCARPEKTYSTTIPFFNNGSFPTLNTSPNSQLISSWTTIPNLNWSTAQIALNFNFTVNGVYQIPFWGTNFLIGILVETEDGTGYFETDGSAFLVSSAQANGVVNDDNYSEAFSWDSSTAGIPNNIITSTSPSVGGLYVNFLDNTPLVANYSGSFKIGLAIKNSAVEVPLSVNINASMTVTAIVDGWGNLDLQDGDLVLNSKVLKNNEGVLNWDGTDMDTFSSINFSADNSVLSSSGNVLTYNSFPVSVSSANDQKYIFTQTVSNTTPLNFTINITSGTVNYIKGYAVGNTFAIQFQVMIVYSADSIVSGIYDDSVTELWTSGNFSRFNEILYTAQTGTPNVTFSLSLTSGSTTTENVSIKYKKTSSAIHA